MQIYVVTEQLSNGESRAVSAHVDLQRADRAGAEVARRHAPGGSVVEPVELDMTGLVLSAGDVNDLTLDQLQASVSNLRVALTRRTSRA